MRRTVLTTILLALLAGLGGCGFGQKGFAEGSFERGMARYDDEDWFEAVENLKLFLRRNPTDERAAEAQFRIGMARYEDEDYPVAAVEFEILRGDYPTSEFVEEAWYMEGLCYVEQVPPTHLEQAVTRKAIDHFRRYLREFPQATRGDESRAKLDELQTHLDRKQLDAVRLYQRLGKHEAARVAVGVLLEERRDSTLRPEILMLAGEIEESLLSPATARTHYAELMNEHADHRLARTARARWERLGGESE